MNQEQLFLASFFLELVQSNFKPSVYDFYVADAKLLDYSNIRLPKYF